MYSFLRNKKTNVTVSKLTIFRKRSKYFWFNHRNKTNIDNVRNSSLYKDKRYFYSYNKVQSLFVSKEFSL